MTDPQGAAKAPLSTTYEPAEIERRWYETWERAGHFRAEPSDKDPFTIVLDLGR